MLNDPEIRTAYQSLMSRISTLNWLLLSYGKSSDGLKLVATGSHGLDELKATMQDWVESVSFALLHHAIGQDHNFVLISYIPEGASGLRRARALFTFRNLRSFFKEHQSVLTIRHMSDLTDDSILAAIANGSKSPQKKIDVIARSSSEFRNVGKTLPRPPDDRLRRARSEDITGDGLSHTLAALGMLDAPPEDRPVVTRAREFDGAPTPPTKVFHPPSRVVVSPDPAERARLREEARLKQQLEEEHIERDERLRQARLRLAKEALLRQHEEDEARRKQLLQRDLERHAALRAQKEEMERLEEEARAKDLEDKKKAARERRIAQTRRAEELRQQEQTKREQQLQQESHTRRSLEDTKEMLRRRGQQIRRERKGGGRILKGWATIQSSDSLEWRRRWFELTEDTLKLFRSEDDNNRPLERIELRSQVEGVKEWWEGFEELKAIPHSFAIVLKHGRGHIAVFMDLATDKESFMGLLLALI